MTSNLRTHEITRHILESLILSSRIPTLWTNYKRGKKHFFYFSINLTSELRAQNNRDKKRDRILKSTTKIPRFGCTRQAEYLLFFFFQKKEIDFNWPYYKQSKIGLHNVMVTASSLFCRRIYFLKCGRSWSGSNVFLYVNSFFFCF